MISLGEEANESTNIYFEVSKLCTDYGTTINEMSWQSTGKSLVAVEKNMVVEEGTTKPNESADCWMFDSVNNRATEFLFKVGLWLLMIRMFR